MDGLDLERIKSNYDLFGNLVSLMFLDIVSGIILAVLRKRVSSTICRRGMAIKAGILMTIGVAVIMEPLCKGLPLATYVLYGFMVSESISILEKLDRIGVPIPAVFVEEVDRWKKRFGLRKEESNVSADE